MTETLDPRTILERALLAERGLRVTLPDAKLAVTFRHRCNKLRERDRKINKEIFPAEDSRYGRSEFDRLTLRIEPEAPTVVIVENGTMEIVSVEEIPADEPVVDGE